MKINEPFLAQYRQLSEYIPGYGDFVVRTGWFTTWHGVVANYDAKTNDMYIIFSNIPLLLFTMSENEQQKETKKISLETIKNAAQGSWAIQQHDHTRNTIIWYI